MTASFILPVCWSLTFVLPLDLLLLAVYPFSNRLSRPERRLCCDDENGA